MAEGFDFSSEGFKESISRNPPTFQQSSVNNAFGMGGQQGMTLGDQVAAQERQSVMQDQMVSSVLESDGFKAMIKKIFAAL